MVIISMIYTAALKFEVDTENPYLFWLKLLTKPTPNYQEFYAMIEFYARQNPTTNYHEIIVTNFKKSLSYEEQFFNIGNSKNTHDSMNNNSHPPIFTFR